MDTLNTNTDPPSVEEVHTKAIAKLKNMQINTELPKAE